MLYSDEDVVALRSEPVTGALSLLDRFWSVVETDQFGNPDRPDLERAELDTYLEVYALLVEVIDAGLLPKGVEYPSVRGSEPNLRTILYQYFKHVHKVCEHTQTAVRLESMRHRFRASIGARFVYEFSQGDLEKVQVLINSLRQAISDLESLEADHKQRLLARLEKLQSELHKKVSDLDRFWGLIGDAGVAIGKLGNDAKPIVDRIREITEIVWQTQSRAEELPSGTKLPQLEHRPDSE